MLAMLRVLSNISQQVRKTSDIQAIVNTWNFTEKTNGLKSQVGKPTMCMCMCTVRLPYELINK